MYAITSTGYRSIAPNGDLDPGETAVEVIPQTLLDTMRGQERRLDRDARLRESDWTVASDSPLSVMQQTAWVTYRQSLRDMPADPAWPDCDWPAEPSLPVGAASI